jgi:hypothetical protein
MIRFWLVACNADMPSEVMFLLPFDNNEVLIDKLDEFVGTTGETVVVQAARAPGGLFVRYAWSLL